VVQRVKDLAFLLLWLWLQLWCRFDLWPGNFCMLKKKKRRGNFEKLDTWSIL